MRIAALQLCAEPIVRAGMAAAWADSLPGTAACHEEGGFILRDAIGTLSVSRWPVGEAARIDVPIHVGSMYNGKEIVATFHTHPNVGLEHQQEPSRADVWTVRDDPELKADWYIGEIVIAQLLTYMISQSGVIAVLDVTDQLLHKG